MAGCKPEYMPVIVAALEAIGDPRWGYHGPATSTGGSAVFLLVKTTYLAPAFVPMQPSGVLCAW
jgi:hypothetical protein